MTLRMVKLALIMGACAGLAACGSTGDKRRNAPDEFAVITKAPLTVPPDYALRPPRPGETRPEPLSSTERTRQILVGDTNAQPPSDGELALLQQLGVLNVDNNIRAILDAENGGRAQKEASLANQLIFWDFEGQEFSDTAAPLRVEDAEAWRAQRLEQINSVTGGGEVVIKRDSRVLNLPGVN